MCSHGGTNKLRCFRLRKMRCTAGICPLDYSHRYSFDSCLSREAPTRTRFPEIGVDLEQCRDTSPNTGHIALPVRISPVSSSPLEASLSSGTNDNDRLKTANHLGSDRDLFKELADTRRVGPPGTANGAAQHCHNDPVRCALTPVPWPTPSPHGGEADEPGRPQCDASPYPAETCRAGLPAKCSRDTSRLGHTSGRCARFVGVRGSRTSAWFAGVAFPWIHAVRQGGGRVGRSEARHDHVLAIRA